MRTWMVVFFSIFIIVCVVSLFFLQKKEAQTTQKQTYWFVLHRKSNTEYLYKGIAGDSSRSKLIKTFRVKTGISRKRPTPLPQLVGREYWVMTKKAPTENPETAPYFLTLDVPAPSSPPYGPAPYLECDGQCNWELPGEFGLHGVNGDMTRLSATNSGSSGCIRHSDKDITHLYHLLNPEREEIRYYVEDK